MLNTRNLRTLSKFHNEINEARELIELSHGIFLKKLEVLETQVVFEKDIDRKYELRKRALILFEDYKNSLQVIEKYIENLYRDANQDTI